MEFAHVLFDSCRIEEISKTLIEMKGKKIKREHLANCSVLGPQAVALLNSRYLVICSRPLRTKLGRAKQASHQRAKAGTTLAISFRTQDLSTWLKMFSKSRVKKALCEVSLKVLNPLADCVDHGNVKCF